MVSLIINLLFAIIVVFKKQKQVDHSLTIHGRNDTLEWNHTPRRWLLWKSKKDKEKGRIKGTVQIQLKLLITKWLC